MSERHGYQPGLPCRIATKEQAMPKVIFDMSMSLDGYATATGIRPEEPMGDGGQQLHQWALGTGDPRSAEVLAESLRRVGATIAGRRTYDLSVPWWGPDGPGGEARTPTFIVSHGTPGQVPEGSVYTFVNSPIEALELAQAAAGDKDVDVFSASIGQQLLRAGRIDEIHVHLVPVLFGAGTRLFEDLGGTHVQLEIIRVDGGVKGDAPALRGGGPLDHRPYPSPSGAGWPADLALHPGCSQVGQQPARLIHDGRPEHRLRERPR